MILQKGVAITPSTCSRRGRSCQGSRSHITRKVVYAAKPKADTNIVSTKKADATMRDNTARLVDRGPVTAEDVRDFNTMFSSLLKEYAYEVDDGWVTGTIPPELYGTYYRNGPGLQIDNPRYQRHTFDGDGMILSLAFRNGKAFFRNRFVRSRGFVEEQAAGRPLFRNSFTRGAADGSPLFNPLDLAFKNVANTGVLAWAGKLYALWEGGLPHVLDPRSLDTEGETRLGGALRGSTFGAHYRVEVAEPGCGRRWVGFSTSMGLGGSSVTFYEFAEDGSLLFETPHPLKDVSLPFIHDMLVSEHYYILVLGPLEFDVAKFATSYIFSRCSIAECLVYDSSKPARVVLVPRPGRPSGRVLSPAVLPTSACFTFHHVNAFEVQRPSETPLVVVDTVAWEEVSFSVNQYTVDPEYYNGGSRSHLVRLVCDPAAGTVARHRLLRRSVEFPLTDPRVTGRSHRVVWAGCDMIDDARFWGPNQGVTRLDIDPRVGLSSSGAMDGDAAMLSSERGAADGVSVDVWYAGDRCFPGEPMFVPRPGSTVEGDGWLLVVVHNAVTQKGEVVILDAQKLSSGPLATIHLPHRLPAGLHGSWHPEYMGPEEEDHRVTATPRWQELGTIRAL